MPFAKAKKRALGVREKMRVASVGIIMSGKQADAVLTGRGEESMGGEELDAVFVGRGFLRDTGPVWTWAEELEVEICIAHQIGWGFGGRRLGSTVSMPVN